MSYWGRAAAATTLRFRVLDANAHREGMVCDVDGDAGQHCHDYFGVTASFGTGWDEFTVMFSEVEQIGMGYHPADGELEVSALFGIEWVLPAPGGKTPRYG